MTQNPVIRMWWFIKSVTSARVDISGPQKLRGKGWWIHCSTSFPVDPSKKCPILILKIIKFPTKKVITLFRDKVTLATIYKLKRGDVVICSHEYFVFLYTSHSRLLLGKKLYLLTWKTVEFPTKKVTTLFRDKVTLSKIYRLKRQSEKNNIKKWLS